MLYQAKHNFLNGETFFEAGKVYTQEAVDALGIDPTSDFQPIAEATATEDSLPVSAPENVPIANDAPVVEKPADQNAPVDQQPAVNQPTQTDAPAAPVNVENQNQNAGEQNATNNGQA